MKNNLALILLLLITVSTRTFGQMGFEQYQYMGEETGVTFVPVVHIQAPKNWYTEARYNYEEDETFSMYIGKNFSKRTENSSLSVIPILGGMLGRYRGGSMGFNVNFEYKKLFISSQPQFTFFQEKRDRNYFFQWSELGYELKPWFFVGCSVQQTYYLQSKVSQIEPGIVAGVIAGKWVFPIYVFNPLETGRYFIVGITLALGATGSH